MSGDPPSLGDWIEAVALGVERGDRRGASVGKELRVIAGLVRQLEAAADAISRGIAHPQAPYAPGDGPHD